MRVFHYVSTYGLCVNSSFWYCFSFKYLVLFRGLKGVSYVQANFVQQHILIAKGVSG